MERRGGLGCCCLVSGSLNRQNRIKVTWHFCNYLLGLHLEVPGRQTTRNKNQLITDKYKCKSVYPYGRIRLMIPTSLQWENYLSPNESRIKFYTY